MTHLSAMHVNFIPLDHLSSTSLKRPDYTSNEYRKSHAVSMTCTIVLSFFVVVRERH